MYFGKRPTSGRMPDSQERALVVEPISIVDDVCTEDDEDAYEEMDEEEEECPTTSSAPSIVPCTEVDYLEASGSFTSAPPHCIVCGRTPTPRTRLFKWPDDQQLRKSWLVFFHLESNHLDKCKDPYICNVHFDADQFLYEGDRVYWRKDPFPRFRQRRTILAVPFPWEVTIDSNKKETQPYRARHGVQHDHNVTFRESFFKSKSKSSHPVAVVSLPGNANIFYEFSYTRTSAVDSSKFYSCLTCRKAKNDTRVKDVIRTIHIKDGTICSRGDPFWGHHFACRPFTSIADPDPSVSASHYADNAVDVQGFPARLRRKAYMSSQTPHPTDSSTSKTNQRVESEEKRQNNDFFFLRTHAFPMTLSSEASKLLLRERKIHSLPRCHLCRKLLPSTELLVQHLQKHLKSCPNCKSCGKKLSPDDSVRIRRARTCLTCMRKRYVKKFIENDG